MTLCQLVKGLTHISHADSLLSKCFLKKSLWRKGESGLPHADSSSTPEHSDTEGSNVLHIGMPLAPSTRGTPDYMWLKHLAYLGNPLYCHIMALGRNYLPSPLCWISISLSAQNPVHAGTWPGPLCSTVPVIHQQSLAFFHRHGNSVGIWGESSLHPESRSASSSSKGFQAYLKILFHYLVTSAIQPKMQSHNSWRKKKALQEKPQLLGQKKKGNAFTGSAGNWDFTGSWVTFEKRETKIDTDSDVETTLIPFPGESSYNMMNKGETPWPW